ncbi:unnamed protein product (macronuclear) [Paramecium tetraurelia]|uniref:WDHD1/CFT4 second beta-propeller domain-containing protein n=1 Tax=Paramecium tetraurelia TaxID=5888 RepID=A0DL28_PARTE|nr:uncharacterized protein GSPATT00018062001 [Paramecium tetraurelia]CAK83745.1 unnamed protein product [Paramecium tetraurelia]|eukprot:XP_001451142.1 hypothetical protein (macronuclear) [Paramecium tetraurelia strain d4-2]
MQSAKEFKSIAITETKGQCGFDISGNTALLAWNQSLVEYDLMEHKKTAETVLESPMQALAIHPLNSQVFAIGDMRVDTYDDIQMTAPSLIVTLTGKVTQIKYNKNGKIMGIASEENSLILNRDTKISRCKPGHDGMIISCAFDPKDRFVCSIGCDGCLIVYQLSQVPHLLQRYTISKQISPDAFQKLQSDFHPSGDSFWIAGRMNAQYIITEDEPQDLQNQYQISHSSEICIIRWIQENCVGSCSLDGEIKLWNFKSLTDLSLHWQFNIKCTPLHMKIIQNVFYLLDCNGNLIETTLDPPKTKYDKIYQDKISAIQDLVDQKTKLRISQRMEEELMDEEIIENKDEQDGIKKGNQMERQQKQNLDSGMQDILRPGETQPSRGRQYLCYNTVGTIILCKNTNMIEFEFFDSTFYKKFKISNQQRYAIGTLNYRGCVLASKGPNDLDEQGYLVGDGKSIVFFQQFIGDVDDFEFALPEEEGAELVAIGNDWFAIMSDHGICRVISFCGLELLEFNTNRAVVSMCAYEHLLCLVFHDTSPMLNQQVLKGRVYDIDLQKQIEEFDIFLTPFSSLSWIGYSDEGLLSIQDSKGVIKIYQQGRWIEVFHNPKVWLYGIQDYKLCLLKTEQPLASMKQEMIQESFEQPFVCSIQDEKLIANYKQFLIQLIILNHELYRWNEFGKYYYARNDDKQNDILLRYTQNLYDTTKIEETQKLLRKYRVDLFKQILNESKDKAIEFFKCHIKDEYDMNSIISLLELQKEKQTTNKEFQKLLNQIKLLQRQQIIKSQQNFNIDKRPQSPKRQGFGFLKQNDQVNMSQIKSILEHKEQHHQQQQQHIQQFQRVESQQEEEEFNPFAKSANKKQGSIFDIGEKRKPTQTFGTQNIKKKN